MIEKHIYCNNVREWFVARNLEHAISLWKDYLREIVGDDPEDYPEIISSFRQLHDDLEITIRIQDEEPITKKCWDLCSDSDYGFLSSDFI